MQCIEWICYGYLERKKKRDIHDTISFDLCAWLPQIAIAFLDDA